MILLNGEWNWIVIRKSRNNLFEINNSEIEHFNFEKYDFFVLRMISSWQNRGNIVKEENGEEVKKKENKKIRK